jgi:hypothetical protein
VDNPTRVYVITRRILRTPSGDIPERWRTSGSSTVPHNPTPASVAKRVVRVLEWPIKAAIPEGDAAKAGGDASQSRIAHGFKSVLDALRSGTRDSRGRREEGARPSGLLAVDN